MSKRPITRGGVPAALRAASSSIPTEAIAQLIGDSSASIAARASLTICHTSTASADAFDMLYLTIGDGEALITLAGDIATEVRVRACVATPAFGDRLVEAGTQRAVGVFIREDVRVELDGSGVLSVDSSERRLLSGIAEYVVAGDLLLLDRHRRVVQNVSPPDAGDMSVMLDRPLAEATFANWRYVRRASAAAHTQLRIGEGTLTVQADRAQFTPYNDAATLAVVPGDTVVVGLNARTVVAVVEGGRVVVLDEAISEPLIDARFAWLPPNGHVVAHALLQLPALEANTVLGIAGTNVDGETGSYGPQGCEYATATGALCARFLDAKDVLHVRVRSGYRQVLSGFPVRGRDTVESGTAPMVCATSISAAAPGAPAQLYHGFSIRVEPPQQHLTRFVNV
jgi:hypothetical protein